MDLSFYPLTLEAIDQSSVEALCLFIAEDERPLTGLAGLADWRLSGKLSRLLRQGVLTGAAGEAVLTPPGSRLGFRKLFVFGLGPLEQGESGLVERLGRHAALDRAGVVVPVAPYGRAIAQHEWQAFQERTNIPVVIDAAAGFEALLAAPGTCAGSIPVTLSFQSTKVFSTGEGGAVVWSDADGLKRVARALNFGFLYKRESTSAGLNGKMSEYHAAVGLAALDGWNAMRQANRAVSDAYRAAAHASGIAERLFSAPDVASNYALVDAGSAQLAATLVTKLAKEDIESRLWYGRGLHHEPYLFDAERDELPATDRLAPSLVGLPIACDIALADVERVIAVTARTLQ